MRSICGASCETCEAKSNCKGCSETSGSPFGGKCIAAKYITTAGQAAYSNLKNQLIAEFNALPIENMPKVHELYELVGSYVNLEYLLPSGEKVKFLDDKNIYLGNQLEIPNCEKCYGLVADTKFLLVCTYSKGGTNSEIVMFKQR